MNPFERDLFIFVNQQALTSAMVLKLLLESFDRRQAANANKAEDEAFATEARKSKGEKHESLRIWSALIAKMRPRQGRLLGERWW